MAKSHIVVINILRSEKKIHVVKYDGSIEDVDYKSDDNLDKILQGVLQGFANNDYEVRGAFEKRLILQRKLE